MYEGWHFKRSRSKARRVVMDLFGLLFAEPNCLPPPWRERAEAAERPASARIAAHHIACMTKRLVLDEHPRLFDLFPKPLINVRRDNDRRRIANAPPPCTTNRN